MGFLCHCWLMPYPVLALQLYPDFFCRYEDPSYLKQLKIEVLIAIADATNAYEIAEEMTQVGGLVVQVAHSWRLQKGRDLVATGGWDTWGPGAKHTGTWSAQRNGRACNRHLQVVVEHV